MLKHCAMFLKRSPCRIIGSLGRLLCVPDAGMSSREATNHNCEAENESWINLPHNNSRTNVFINSYTQDGTRLRIGRLIQILEHYIRCALFIFTMHATYCCDRILMQKVCENFWNWVPQICRFMIL